MRKKMEMRKRVECRKTKKEEVESQRNLNSKKKVK
jgi:hypothetical protein